MTVTVDSSSGSGPTWEEALGSDSVDLGCPDPADLLGPDDIPPTWLLLGTGPTTMPGQWVDAGASAWFAEANRAALEQARWTLEASRSQAATSTRVLDRPRAAKIVAASLGWSDAYAAARLEFARQVLERLPALGTAMASGVLEERKATIFTTTLAELDTDQARTVVERVLPAAPRLAFAALRARIEEAAEAVDPDWAAARRAAAIARRRVTLRVAPSGAAELCGLDLPEEPAQDAHDRIVALGRVIARRLRRSGLDAPVGPIESEVMLTLTGPSGAGMWDADVVDHVVGRFGGPTGDDDDGSPPEGPGGPDDGPDDNAPGDSDDDPGDDDPGDDDPGDDDPGDDDPDGTPSRSADDGGTATGPNDHCLGVDDAGASPHAAAPEHGLPENEPRQNGPWRVPFVPRVALRVQLSTLLGLDRHPGVLPGRGPVVPSVAVSMAWRRTHSRWRLLLYDRRGALEHVLTVRPPRTGRTSAHAAQCGHQVVEITAYTDELDDVLRGTSPRSSVIPGDALGLLSRAARALATARARPTEEHPAHTVAEADRRFPGAALRAWVQARDRTCRAPGCAADAVGCDIDHTRSFSHGGWTVADDLGAFCRRDHRFKHDPESGWTVTQPSPGRFVWAAPTGRVHVVEPERYEPVPDPVPPGDGSPCSVPHRIFDPPPRPQPPGQPRRNRHGCLTDAALRTADHLRRRARGRSDGDEQPTRPGAPAVDRYPEEPPF